MFHCSTLVPRRNSFRNNHHLQSLQLIMPTFYLWLLLLINIMILNAYKSKIHKKFRTKIYNEEEKLNLERGIESCSFLNNINEYGNAKMARRAVGILQKMPAYFVQPNVEHYNAAILACEKGESFPLGYSVFEQMLANNIPMNTQTYCNLISCAEKCKKWEEALEILELCKKDSNILKPTTKIYNTAIWAAERADNSTLVLELIKEMEDADIPRDEMTYCAAMNACEKNAEGEIALHIFDLMRIERISYTSPICQAALWSCVKSGLWQDALNIFDMMGIAAITREVECYDGAIWACQMGGHWERALELLRLMKVDKNFKRKTIAYDGAISALGNAGQWEKARELLIWMDREKVPKSPISYRGVIDALYTVQQWNILDEVYTLALRENFFNPWVTGTRRVNIAYYPPSIAYCAIKTVLESFKDGKNAAFDLYIGFYDVPDDEGHSFEDVQNILSIFDPQQVMIKKLLEVDNEDGLLKILIKRECLLAWIATADSPLQ